MFLRRPTASCAQRAQTNLPRFPRRSKLPHPSTEITCVPLRQHTTSRPVSNFSHRLRWHANGSSSTDRAVSSSLSIAGMKHIFVAFSLRGGRRNRQEEGQKQEEGSCRMQESRVLEWTRRDCFGRTHNLELAVWPTSSSGAQPRQTHASIVRADRC